VIRADGFSSAQQRNFAAASKRESARHV